VGPEASLDTLPGEEIHGDVVLVV